MNTFKQEVENPMVLPVVQHRYVEPTRVVEETCSECIAKARVKVHGVCYCWDCAEVEGVEKV
jgi:hypothetical protein